MIKNFYADNFRSLRNFTIELDEVNLFLGPNGTGKTSVLDALRNIQALIVRGLKVDEIFLRDDLPPDCRNGRRKIHQRFGIKTCDDKGDDTYRYMLKVEHEGAYDKRRIAEEILEHNGNPIFEFSDGMAQLYHDDYQKGPEYPFDWSQSGIASLHARHDNQKLTRFKKEVANYIVVNTCPPLVESEARTEDEFLEPYMQNFVAWYRHIVQEDMGLVAELISNLKEPLPGFDTISLSEISESARVFKAVFRSSDNKPARYSFAQLSDGQRALIMLYSLITFAKDRRFSLFIDKPDNYLSLREIQPWLIQAVECCGESLEQMIVVSHHPIIIDYMAGADGKWFFRDGDDGPIQVSNEPRRTVDGLSLSETIIRGWEE